MLRSWFGNSEPFSSYPDIAQISNGSTAECSRCTERVNKDEESCKLHSSNTGAPKQDFGDVPEGPISQNEHRKFVGKVFHSVFELVVEWSALRFVCSDGQTWAIAFGDPFLPYTTGLLLLLLLSDHRLMKRLGNLTRNRRNIGRFDEGVMQTLIVRERV